MGHRISVKALGLVGVLLASQHNSTFAVDAAYVWWAGGKKAENVTLGAQWDWDKRWPSSNGYFVRGYWDASVSHWHGSDRFTLHQSQTLFVAGLTPVFRWQRDSRSGFYWEGGIGVRYITELWDNAARQLSTYFQFGDTIAVGYMESSGLDIGLKLEHTSNAGIKMPNSGMNFLGARLNYRF